MTISLEESQRHFKSLTNKGESVAYYAQVFTDPARKISDYYKSGKMSAGQALSMLGGYVVARHKPASITADDWKKNILKQSSVFTQKYEDLVRYLNGNADDVSGEILRLRATIPAKTISVSDLIEKAQKDASAIESVSVVSTTEALSLIEIANTLLVKAGLKPVQVKANLQVAS